MNAEKRNQAGQSSDRCQPCREEMRRSTLHRLFLAAWVAWCCLCFSPVIAHAQNATAPPPSPTIQLAAPPSTSTGPPLTLSLADALTRAERNSPQFQAAATQAKLAHENQVQARAATLPSFSYRMDYLNTQGNKISPVGRFVTNDGVHVYRAWAVVHQDMPGSFFIGAGPRLAAYGKALADAQEEVARRGLRVTITHDYYALLVAQRAYATAQQSLANAQHFLKISEDLEKGGEVAHADVIRFQLQASQAQRALEDAQLAMSNAQLNLAVLLFPDFNENFTVVDDLETPPPLPSFAEATTMAQNRNPDLQSALAAYHETGMNVAMARAAFFPSLSIDFDYGIEANALALHSVNTTKPGVVQPNLGYFVTYSLTMPVWDWGSMWSKLHAAEDQKQLAHVDLTYAQRNVLASLYSYYNQAAVAWNQLTSLRQSADLAARNLQLVTLQYQAGESQVLQVVDAETSFEQARDNESAGEAAYRDALATLQTMTGSF
jgi:outer membrane protein TolC